jgi:hypothetical protein
VHCFGFGENIIGFVVYFVLFHFFDGILRKEGDSKDNLSLQYSSRVSFDEWIETYQETYKLLAPPSKLHHLNSCYHIRLAEDRIG